MTITGIHTDLKRICGREALPETETLSDVLRRLDTVAQTADVPERLAHYLSNRSYQKALDWIQDPSIPHRT